MFLGGKDPLRQRFTGPLRGPAPMTIVGVVGDVRVGGLDQEAQPEIYLPHRQPVGFMMLSHMTVLLRSRLDPTALTLALRNEMKSIDRDLPLYGFRATEDYFLRHTLGIFGAFGEWRFYPGYFPVI